MPDSDFFPVVLAVTVQISLKLAHKYTLLHAFFSPHNFILRLSTVLSYSKIPLQCVVET